MSSTSLDAVFVSYSLTFKMSRKVQKDMKSTVHCVVLPDPLNARVRRLIDTRSSGSARAPMSAMLRELVKLGADALERDVLEVPPALKVAS